MRISESDTVIEYDKEAGVYDGQPSDQTKRARTRDIAIAFGECFADMRRRAGDAGKLVSELVDDVWGGDIHAAHDEFSMHHKMHMAVFDRLLRVGRGEMLPEILFDNSPCAKYLERMPIEEQRALLIDKRPVPVVDAPDQPRTEWKPAAELNPAKCELVFVKSGNQCRVRTESEVRAVAKKSREAETIVFDAPQAINAKWYKLFRNSAVLLNRRAVTRGMAADLLSDIITHSEPSDITESEKRLAMLLSEKLNTSRA